MAASQHSFSIVNKHKFTPAQTYLSLHAEPIIKYVSEIQQAIETSPYRSLKEFLESGMGWRGFTDSMTIGEKTIFPAEINRFLVSAEIKDWLIADFNRMFGKWSPVISELGIEVFKKFQEYFFLPIEQNKAWQRLWERISANLNDSDQKLILGKIRAAFFFKILTIWQQANNVEKDDTELLEKISILEKFNNHSLSGLDEFKNEIVRQLKKLFDHELGRREVWKNDKTDLGSLLTLTKSEQIYETLRTLINKIKQSLVFQSLIESQFRVETEGLLLTYLIEQVDKVENGLNAETKEHFFLAHKKNKLKKEIAKVILEEIFINYPESTQRPEEINEFLKQVELAIGTKDFGDIKPKVEEKFKSKFSKVQTAQRKRSSTTVQSINPLLGRSLRDLDNNNTSNTETSSSVVPSISSESIDKIIDYLVSLQEQYRAKNLTLLNAFVGGAGGRVFTDNINFSSIDNSTGETVTIKIMPDEIKQLILSQTDLLESFAKLFETWQPNISEIGLEEFRKKFWQFFKLIENNPKWGAFLEKSELSENDKLCLHEKLSSAFVSLIKDMWTKPLTEDSDPNSENRKKYSAMLDQLNIWAKINSALPGGSKEVKDTIKTVLEGQIEKVLETLLGVDPKKIKIEFLEKLKHFRTLASFAALGESAEEEMLQILINFLQNRLKGTDKRSEQLRNDIASAILIDLEFHYPNNTNKPTYVSNVYGSLERICGKEFIPLLTKASKHAGDIKTAQSTKPKSSKGFSFFSSEPTTRKLKSVSEKKSSENRKSMMETTSLTLKTKHDANNNNNNSTGNTVAENPKALPPIGSDPHIDNRGMQRDRSTSLSAADRSAILSNRAVRQFPSTPKPKNSESTKTPSKSGPA